MDRLRREARPRRAAPFGSLCKTDEAKAFNQAHGDNKKWHYVNFPVGSKKYSLASRFAYPHDVVHLINGCVTVLEGGEFENLTPKDALRFLIHLVGDVHQPLHTVAGYRTKYAQVVKEQLRKGGIHLAQLLNAINWDANP
jgi:hypothetical protein